MADSYSFTYSFKKALLIISLPVVFTLTTGFKNSAKSPTIPDRVENEMAWQLRLNVVEYAQEYLGLKYHYAGTSPETGFDCSGFTSYALKAVDVKVSPSSASQSRQGDKIPLDEVLPGDLVFFGYRGRVTHVALVVERKKDGIYCVHSTCSRGIVVENISTSKYWRPKILFARDVISKQGPF